MGGEADNDHSASILPCVVLPSSSISCRPSSNSRSSNSLQESLLVVLAVVATVVVIVLRSAGGVDCCRPSEGGSLQGTRRRVGYDGGSDSWVFCRGSGGCSV